MPELDPLGYRATPEGSTDLPAYSRQRRPDAIAGEVASLSRPAEGLLGLLYRSGGEGPETPALVRFDADGTVMTKESLTDLSSNRVDNLERLGNSLRRSVEFGLDIGGRLDCLSGFAGCRRRSSGPC
jgi:hypothetical protein